MSMKILEIATVTKAASTYVNQDQHIDVLVYDSRKASGHPQELFIALTGSHRNGHDFIPQLHELGVRNFLINENYRGYHFAECNVLRVGDTLEALQSLGMHKRDIFYKEVVGITGSNGKTIVKEWLSTILEQDRKVLKSPKSYNSQLGVPISIWPLDDKYDVAVFEAGISKVDEMQKLEAMIRPTLGIFTNIGQAHDEGFASRQEKVAEKRQLFVGAEKVVCRVDHQEIVEELSAKGISAVTWGFDRTDANINIQSSENHYRFDYENGHYNLKVTFNSPFDLENIFHAIIAAVILEVEEENIQLALDKLKPVPMRLELKKGNNNTYILDDSYNNDLLGLAIALDYLLQQPHKQEKTVILSDILQSGKVSSELYKEVNVLLEKHHIGKLVGVGPQIVENSKCFSMNFQGFADTSDLLKNIPDFANEIILVKGARDYELEQVVAYLEERNHGTVMEVNFESIVHNLKMYRSRLNPEVKLMVMVKAFAYGVGVEEVAHLLQYHKADYLGVAYLDEAIHLRKKGITLPIMIMNVEWNSFSLLETFALEPEIYSLSMLRKYLEDCKNPPSIHLKIETGMNRLGFNEAELPELLTILKANPQLSVAGIFTHFSSADMAEEDDFTSQQASKFEKAYHQISDRLGYAPIKHALNSAGIVRWPQYQYDMVRLGIGLYGFDSSGEEENLRPISTLKTRISQVKSVNKGDSIGYSRKGKADKAGQIAIIAIGYADGYSRAFSNGNAYVSVIGQQAPTIGNVCMDMTMIDVTGLDVKEGDEVIIFGENPTIVDLANWANTIPYEILTNVSQRVKRVFVSE